MSSYRLLLNAIRGRAEQMDDSRGVARHGIVTNVNPANGTVRVAVDEGDPENGIPPTITGWLPIAQLAAGNGWSAVCLPLPGTQVFMVPDMGFADHGVVVGATHSTAAPIGKFTPYDHPDTAQPLVPGEFTVTHASGSGLRLTDGRVEIMGDLYVSGNVIVRKDVSDQNGSHGTLNLLRTDHNQHEHTGVQTGGGTTSTPTLVTP